MTTRRFEAIRPDDFAERVRRSTWTRAITAVHVHHTFIPTERDYMVAADKEAVIRAMWKFHTDPKPRGNGWGDIAQHVSIAPDGLIWTGRDWNRPPASSGGHNGTSRAGPFMLEMIGNYDKGSGEMLDHLGWRSTLVVVTTMLEVFGLQTSAVKFHRQLGSPKTCPGSGIDYAAFLRELGAFTLGTLYGRQQLTGSAPGSLTVGGST